jgi:hypothetical protein
MSAIAFYGRIDLGTGCLANMTDGGDGMCGYTHPEKSLQKMRTNHADFSGNKNPNYNNPWSEEQKKNLSEKTKGLPSPVKGIKRTAEQNKRNSTAQKKRFENPENHTMKNRFHTVETKQKQREAKLVKLRSEEARKKQSETVTGDKNHFYNKHHSDESKNMISRTKAYLFKIKTYNKLLLEFIGELTKNITMTINCDELIKFIF